MGVLEELGAAARSVADRVGPAVVGVRSGRGRGSGVVVAAGRVVTNAHNLRGEEGRGEPPVITLIFADGRSVSARPLGTDPDGDLCVLEADTTGVVPVAWPEEGAGSLAGDPVFALANPGGGGVRVSFGIVSSARQPFRGPRGRKIAEGLEHTAPLPRGSSGGPVVDGTGRLLGVNTHRLGEGAYLALPATVALLGRIEALGRGESPRRVLLGVGLAPGLAARELRRAVGLPDRDGLLVRAVEDGSPADRAGIRTGDLIVGAGGAPIVTTDDLHGAVDAAAGGPLPLAILRGAEECEVTVDLS